MEATNLSPVRISGSFVETKNGRLRREQRAIDKRDLQTAKKEGVKSYSIKRSNGDPTAVYEYKDIVYVINDTTGEEITSYAFPILLEPVPISTEMKRNYEDAIHLIKSDKSKRKSNTVIVVDVTGSMRKSDVWGTKTRLDAVWLSIALDFVAKRIESGAVGLLDVLSIVSLGPTSDVLISEEPISWIIYNKIVDFYNNKTITPHGHGFYMSSLDNVESLLTKNCNASCAIGLCFISDGQPSDIVKKCYKGKRWLRAVSERFGSIVKKIARRLIFNAVGIGNSDDFETLRAMVKTAEDFGSKSSFLLPSMTSSALGDIFETFAISLTAKEIEIGTNLTRQQPSIATSALGTISESFVTSLPAKKITTDTNMSRQQSFRKINKEACKKKNIKIEHVADNESIDTNMPRQQSFRKVNTESCKKENIQIEHVTENEFHIYSKEDVLRMVYREWREEKMRYFQFEDATLQYPEAACVAISKEVFRKGAERVIYRFYELKEDGETIVGKEMIAKESRFIIENNLQDEEKRKDFVQDFCSNQQLACRIAEEFNAKMDSLSRVHERTPKIKFLDCFVYMLHDINAGNLSVLVEERLDQSKWRKWNTDRELIEGMDSTPQFSEDELYNTMDTNQIALNLGDEKDSDGKKESDNYELQNKKTQSSSKKNDNPIIFSPFEVAQAFSYFSYFATSKQRLICNLQGVYIENENLIKLSDPVIHCNKKSQRHCIHGRTDLGWKGIEMFHDMHKHYYNDLCRLVTHGFKRDEIQSSAAIFNPHVD